MYSNLVNLSEFFAGCMEEYCIIKIPASFPNYKEYSDLDILCADREMVIKYTVDFLKRYDNIDVRVSYPKNGKHAHVDVYPHGKTLDFKFDLIDSFALYEKNAPKTGFEKLVLENKTIVQGVYIPATPYEMVIRMLEYLEHFKERPEKIKHLRWVESQVAHTEEFNQLWNSYINMGDE